MQDANQFITTLLSSVTIAHVLHFKTRSYAQHMALGSFYSELENLTDGLFEEYLGCTENAISKPFPSVSISFNQEPLSFLKDLHLYVKENRSAMGEESNIQNTVDSILSCICTCIYKVENLS